eukprot:jgi/Bigna1/145496/aug1.100_g20204
MDAGWKKLPDMNTERSGLGVAVGDGKTVCCWWGRGGLGVAVGDGKLFAVGGHDGNDELKSGEYLDLKNVGAGWKKLPDMDAERNGSRDENDLKSGEHLDLKNVDAGWKKIPDMNTERSCLGVAVGDGKLFAVGGYGDGYLKSGEYLDLKKMDAGWTKLPDMNTERRHLGVAVGDGWGWQTVCCWWE